VDRDCDLIELPLPSGSGIEIVNKSLYELPRPSGRGDEESDIWALAQTLNLKLK
jgi:hypothetical protein